MSLSPAVENSINTISRGAGGTRGGFELSSWRLGSKSAMPETVVNERCIVGAAGGEGGESFAT